VAQAFAGLNNDNRSLPGVFLGVVMGRDAGFLTAASALAKRYEDDAPHLIYVPEAVFDKDKFLSDIQKVYDKLGRCVVAVSEGIKDSDGNPIITSLVNEVERDSHGNVQLSGTGALCDSLVDLIKNGCNVNKVRGDTFGYLQRSFSGVVSESDAKEARAVGEMAVKYSTEDSFIGGSIAIKRVGDYAVTFEATPLNTVARHTKSLPDNFYDIDKAMVTEQFIKYASPLAGEIDRGVRIFAPKVEKVLGK
jgi:6-phosphofructokinase 1